MRKLLFLLTILLSVNLAASAGVITIPSSGGSYTNAVTKYTFKNASNDSIWLAQRSNINRDDTYGWRPYNTGIVLQVSGATTLTFTVKSNTTSSRSITGQAYAISDTLYYIWKNTAIGSSLETYTTSVNGKSAGSRTDEEAAIANHSEYGAITGSSDGNKKKFIGETVTKSMTAHGSAINHSCPTTKGNTNTFTVSLTSAGKYLIYLTSSEGSVGITQINVVAACTSISPTLSYSSTSLAAGGTSSSPTVSGNSGSGAVTYSVTASSPSGSATVDSGTGVVTGVAAGTATVTASIAAASTYCAGSATASFTITSCSTPTISTSPSSANYCQGDTPTALSFSGSGHNAQKWQYYDGDSWEDTGTTTATYSPSTSSTGSTQYRVVTTCDNYDTYYTASSAATIGVKTNPNLSLSRD